MKSGGAGDITILWVIEKANRDNTLEFSGWFINQPANEPSVGDIAEAADTNVKYYYSTKFDGPFTSELKPTDEGTYFCARTHCGK